MSIDSIGNFLTIIRNGLHVRKSFVVIPYSHLKEAVVQLLKDEGYIRDFSVQQEAGTVKLSIKILLKYVGGEPVIHEITRVSKPGRRLYERASALTPVIGGLGISVLSTSQGILTDVQARKKCVGGEVICHVW